MSEDQVEIGPRVPVPPLASQGPTMEQITRARAMLARIAPDPGLWHIYISPRAAEAVGTEDGAILNPQGRNPVRVHVVHYLPGDFHSVLSLEEMPDPSRA